MQSWGPGSSFRIQSQLGHALTTLFSYFRVRRTTLIWSSLLKCWFWFLWFGWSSSKFSAMLVLLVLRAFTSKGQYAYGWQTPCHSPAYLPCELWSLSFLFLSTPFLPSFSKGHVCSSKVSMQSLYARRALKLSDFASL